DAVLGWVVEVTSLKETEDELRRINFLADTALELTRSGYWQINYDDPEFFVASERAREIFGEAPKPDNRYHRMHEFHARVVAADREIARQVAELYQGAVDGKYDQYDATYPYLRPADGRTIWTRARATVVRDA